MLATIADVKSKVSQIDQRHNDAMDTIYEKLRRLEDNHLVQDKKIKFVSDLNRTFKQMQSSYQEMVNKIQCENLDHRDRIRQMVTDFAETVESNSMQLKTSSE